MSPTQIDILETIPPPALIRNRLAELARESFLLRALLKVSERKQLAHTVRGSALGTEVRRAD
jgi:hypothetical protein